MDPYEPEKVYLCMGTKHEERDESPSSITLFLQMLYGHVLLLGPYDDHRIHVFNIIRSILPLLVFLYCQYRCISPSVINALLLFL